MAAPSRVSSIQSSTRQPQRRMPSRGSLLPLLLPLLFPIATISTSFSTLMSQGRDDRAPYFAPGDPPTPQRCNARCDGPEMSLQESVGSFGAEEEDTDLIAMYRHLDGDLHRLEGEMFAHFPLQDTRDTQGRATEDIMAAAEDQGCSILTHGLDLMPGDKVLDVGSGIGSVALCVARAFPGVRVYGISIARDELAISRVAIADQGLASRVTFHYADMNRLPIADGAGGAGEGAGAAAAEEEKRGNDSEEDGKLVLVPGTFALVINRESLAYARRLGGYMADVSRLLRPGGRWRSIAGLLRRATLTHDEVRRVHWRRRRLRRRCWWWWRRRR